MAQPKVEVELGY